MRCEAFPFSAGNISRTNSSKEARNSSLEKEKKFSLPGSEIKENISRSIFGVEKEIFFRNFEGALRLLTLGIGKAQRRFNLCFRNDKCTNTFSRSHSDSSFPANVRIAKNSPNSLW